MLKQVIEKLIRREDLTSIDINFALEEMFSVDNESQIAAFLCLLAAKGETVEEITAMVTYMRDKMVKLPIEHAAIDIVGTGGDGQNIINISTGSAILAASCGIKVVKHGNRAVSSQCGSADVLEKLGVNLNCSEISACINNLGFGFCYAPNFHPMLKKLKTVRRKLAIPTVFNLLGPLLNPAQVKYMMLGVSRPELMSVMASVLQALNIERAMVFHSQGTDEITCAGITQVIEVTNRSRKHTVIDPRDYGFSICELNDLCGGSAEENALVLKKVLKGQSGPIADTLILNAGVANYVYSKTESIADGVALARQRLVDGHAEKLLTQLIQYSNRSVSHA